MVIIKQGYYFCHTFDLKTRFSSFGKWFERDTLPVAPMLLRYQEIKLGETQIIINQMGFVVAFQPIPNATNFSEALNQYKEHFDSPYSELRRLIYSLFKIQPVGDTSFLVMIGSPHLILDWEYAKVPLTQCSISILIEALFIDELCRVLERQSDSFLKPSTLTEDRLIAEYAESLFPLAHPAGFLIGNDEIELMEKYFIKWNLNDRVKSLHQRFSESVLNSALYNGHLERNRQNILNTVLAAIAFISLAEVSSPISKVLDIFPIQITESQLNQFFVVIALLILTSGFWQFLLKPWLGILTDNIKRFYLTTRAKKGKSQD